MRRQIIKVIEQQVNPAIASHNGRIELVDYMDKNVYLKMLGGCQGCASSTATLRNGIERILRESFGDDIRDIIDVTKHEEGQTPYFKPSASDQQTPFA